MVVNTCQPVRRDRGAGLAYANALSDHGRFVFRWTRAVTPIQAPQPGGVRPEAGSDVQMATLLVNATKGDVCARSLDPPI